MVGVDVGELDVNQQHDLNLNNQSQKENNQASLTTTKPENNIRAEHEGKIYFVKVWLQPVSKV